MIVGLFAVVVFRFLLRELEQESGSFVTAFSQSDWLINYSGGFVRRGFAGTVIRLLDSKFGLGAHAVITALAVASFLAVFLAYGRQIVRLINRIDPLALSLLLFLPSLIMFPILDNRSLGRKEWFFVLLLVFHLVILERTLRSIRTTDSAVGTGDDEIRRYLWRFAIAFNILGVPVALTHESILFLAIPLNALILMRVLSIRSHAGGRLLVSVGVFGPTVVASLSGYLWRGHEVVQGICESWESLGVLECFQDGRSGAIEALDWSFWEAIALPRRVVSSISSLGWWLFIFGLVLGLLLIATVRLVASFERHERVSNGLRLTAVVYGRYLLVPLAFSIPVFAVGWDWGRWLWVVSMSFAFVLTSPEILRIEGLHSARLAHLRPCNSPDQWFQRRWWVTLNEALKLDSGRVMLAFYSVALFTIFFVRVPACCVDSGVVKIRLWSYLQGF